MSETEWSKERLDKFYQEFQAHAEQERIEREQQHELHVAVFQKEDKESNTPAGVLQLLSRVDARLSSMEITADRQKNFIGGVFFAFAAVGFFFTDTAHRVLGFLKGL